MNEPSQDDLFSDLERQLNELFQPGSLDPDFANRLESRLVAQVEAMSQRRPSKLSFGGNHFSIPGHLLGWGSAALLLVLMLALVWGISHLLPVEPPTGGRSALQTSVSPPALVIPGSPPAPKTPEAQPGLGKLAYVSAGDIWVRSLPDDEPQRLTSDGLNREPRWSPSGEWLAFYKGADQAWISKADSGENHPLSDAGTVGSFAWSPVKDQLAYIANGGELHLVQAGGGEDRTLVSQVGSRQIGRLAWSPDGGWIAFEWFERAENQPASDAGLWKVPFEGGDPQEVYSGPVTLAGWSADGRSLVFWNTSEQFSASLLADGATLGMVPADGGEPQMLADPVLVFNDFLSLDPSGSNHLAYVAGGGRETWKNKALVLYTGGQASVLTPPEQAVSSPVWSPDGSQIAYVSTESAGQDASQEALRQVLMARHIWIMDVQSGRARQLTGDSAYRDERPLWSRDGSQLLFVRLDGEGQVSVWLLPSAGGEPRQVVDSLAASQDVGGASAADSWFGYYGHIDWGELLDWWQPLQQDTTDGGPTGTATSPLVGQLTWQTDGRFGVRMLRPSSWVPVELGPGRGYMYPGFQGTDNQLALRALNYQVVAQQMSSGILAQYEIFKQNSSLDGWTAGIEHMWQQDAIEFTIEETLSEAKSQPGAKIYWVTVPGWDKIQLSAFVVDQGQPLGIDLTAGGEYADKDRLRDDGILNDFKTIVASLSAIPYDPENVDPPLGETDSASATTAAIGQSSPTPASTGYPSSLNLSSPDAEIRRRILNPVWSTLWLQGQASAYSPNGLQQNTYVQGWLERGGAGRVLTTDPLFGSLGFNLDMDPRWVWISDGQSLTLFDRRSEQFDPSAATKEWVSHPLEASGETIGMLFPSYLALRSEELQTVEMSAQAGRPALVVDWSKYRLWVDAQTGVLLRQQTRSQDGQVSSDIALQAVLYDLPLPAGLLNTQDLGAARFEAPPAALPTPEANLPEAPAPNSTPLKVVFQVSTPQGVELFVATDTGADLVQLTHDQSLDIEPACAPDGSRIAFSAVRDGQKDIYLIDPDGSNETRLSDGPADDSEPAFSPDGTRIAFVSERDGNPEIYVMNVDGTQVIRLTNDPANDISPAWSPDGTQLLFTSDREGQSQIYRMNSDGSGLVNLSNNPASDFGPVWSPDGEKIAFYSPDRGGNGQEAIYVMTRDGANVAPLTGAPAGRLQDDRAPAWSPDGRQILFYSIREGIPSGIFATRADGSGLLGLELALTPRTLEAANPCWLPAQAGSGSGAASVPETSASQTGGPYVTFTSGDSSITMVNIRSGPSTMDPILATLPAGSQLPALGKTAEGDWIQVEYPPGSGQAGWVYALLATLNGGPLPVVATPAPGSAKVEGRIILGYGSHLPAAGEQISLQEDVNGEPLAVTDENGHFILTGLPPGRIALAARHLTFEATITSPGEVIDLGLLKYPLVHPPSYYFQQPSPGPGLSTLQFQGEILPFISVYTGTTWTLPSLEEERQQVWSHRPFSDQGEAFLQWWFNRPALLYDTIDIFSQGLPGGPDLDQLGADWRYLLGLWNAPDFLDSPAYDAGTLEDLLARRQVEVWLLGYRAQEVRRLGGHYLVTVEPAAGFQVIRFAGNESALQVHVVNAGAELAVLPKFCRNAQNPDCSQ